MRVKYKHAPHTPTRTHTHQVPFFECDTRAELLQWQRAEYNKSTSRDANKFRSFEGPLQTIACNTQWAMKIWKISYERDTPTERESVREREKNLANSLAKKVKLSVANKRRIPILILKTVTILLAGVGRLHVHRCCKQLETQRAINQLGSHYVYALLTQAQFNVAQCKQA